MKFYLLETIHFFLKLIQGVIYMYILNNTNNEYKFTYV